MQVLGIDIGGSGIKGAPVDVRKGELVQERFRLPTPQPSKPEAVGHTVNEIVKHFNWDGPIGCTFPAIVKHGVTHTAANVDKEWIGTDAQKLIALHTGKPVVVLNDADAAGLAEMQFGAGRSVQDDDIVMILTFGTGIGSALFVAGRLLPNTELGHLDMGGKIAEHRASDRIRDEENLSWKKWGKRVNTYLQYLEFLFSPDMFVIGGGVSKKHEKFFPYIDVEAKIVPAELRNEAGIVGAALAAQHLHGQ